MDYREHLTWNGVRSQADSLNCSPVAFIIYGIFAIQQLCVFGEKGGRRERILQSGYIIPFVFVVGL